jgi:hypothetical protein
VWPAARDGTLPTAILAQPANRFAVKFDIDPRIAGFPGRRRGQRYGDLHEHAHASHHPQGDSAGRRITGT